MTSHDITNDDERSQTPVTIITNSARFALGQVVATPGALALLQRTGRSAASLCARHMHGDWGDTCEDDAALNELALINGSKVFAWYRLVENIWLASIPYSQRKNLPTIWIETSSVNEVGIREVTTIFCSDDW